MTLTKNRLTGIVSLILGGLYLYATSRLVVPAVADPIGPKAFPYLVSFGLLIVGLLLVLKREKVTEKNRAVIFDLKTEKDLMLRIGLTCLAGLIFGVILEPLGYLIAAFLFMSAMLFITYGARYVFNFSIGLTFAVTTYILFFVLLEVSLPRGILAF